MTLHRHSEQINYVALYWDERCENTKQVACEFARWHSSQMRQTTLNFGNTSSVCKDVTLSLRPHFSGKALGTQLV